jgi:lysophospholipase L1-like esterase
MSFQYRWRACAALFLSTGLFLSCFTGCTQLQPVWQDILENMRGNTPDHEVQADAGSNPGQTQDVPQKDPNFPEHTIIPAKPVELDPGRDEPDEPDVNQPPGEDDQPDEPDVPQVYGALPEGERVDDAYFDDAVFIGDSVSLMLQYYAISMRAEDADFLGKAQFLTAGSFSYRHAVSAVSDASIHPAYNGEEMLLEDAIAQMGAKKIYIMLGMNDISNGNYTRTLDNITTLVSRILEKTPDAVFYFESVTPRMENSETSYLNNDIIATFNSKLAEYCVENEHYFVNVYEGVCDENGNLPAAYCGDPVSEGGKGMGIHFTYAGCAAWVDYLYTHTA